MLGMLRQLEASRRDTAVLRGALEEIQREQEAGRKRLQNYYLDLDGRIQALQRRERAARQSGENGDMQNDAPLLESSPVSGDQSNPAVTNAPEPVDSTGPSSVDLLEQYIDDEPLLPLQIVPADAPLSETSSFPDAVDRAPEPVLGGAPQDRLERQRVELPGPEGGDPGVMKDIQDAGNKVQQAPDRLPVTAHGLIMTDWGVSAQQSEPSIPAEAAQ